MTFGRNITLSLILHFLVLVALVLAASGPYKQYMEAREKQSALMVDLSGEDHGGEKHAGGAENGENKIASVPPRPLEDISQKAVEEEPEVVEKPIEQTEALPEPLPREVRDKTAETGEEESAIGIILEHESTLVSGNTGQLIEEGMSGTEAGEGETLSASPAGGESHSSSGSDTGDLRERYMDEIRKAIERAVTYPPMARKRRITGTVLASFHINADGLPERIEILNSSGYDVLDRETVKIIKRASPFPPLGERVEVPVRFNLVSGSSL